MTGGYQTAGESARRGTNIWPKTGGGWMNGRGDDTMTMFVGYGHMVDFFTSFEWWKMEPHDESVDNGNYCLAKPGETYAVYLPSGGKVTVKLEPGRCTATWFGAVTGEKLVLSFRAQLFRHAQRLSVAYHDALHLADGPHVDAQVVDRWAVDLRGWNEPG